MRQADPAPPAKGPERVEPRIERLRRHRRHAGLYFWAFGLVAVVIVLIALTIENTRQVKLSWIVGTSHASLVWIILASAVLGWLVGILTGVVFRLRTRRRRPARQSSPAVADDSPVSDARALTPDQSPNSHEHG